MCNDFFSPTVPHVPTVSIAVSRDSTIAGNTFSLTCSLVATPVNGTNDPVLTWRGPGVEQNSVQLSSNSSISVLTFNPLRTSHGGVYTCEARLGTSDLASSVSEIVTVQSKFTLCLLCLHGRLFFCSSISSGGDYGTSHSLQWDGIYSEWCCSAGSQC